MNKLSFSVIVPVYNGQKYLRETLESLVNQDYSSFEIIAVDDGSSDCSAEIIQSFDSIKYVHQENQGNAVARNRGIALSTGDFIALIDQDDIWVPEKLSTFCDYFSAHPAIDFATAKHRMFLSDGVEVPAWCRDDDLNRDIVDYSPGSLVFRRRLFDRIGPFDQSLVSGHDTDWVLRVKDRNTPIAVLPDVLLLKRVHEANQSSEVSRAHSELLEVFRRSINRNKEKPLSSTTCPISVIIPVYNNANYLDETISSVLNQSLKPEQVIVIDDGSTDGTEKIAKSHQPHVDYIYQENSGANAARNKGVENAIGQFVAFLDGDDLWEPEKLETQMRCLFENPNVDAVFAHVQNFYSPDLEPGKQATLKASLSPVAGHIPSTMVIKKEALSSIGLFDEGVTIGDFMQWLFRARDGGISEVMLPDILVKRRIHGGNTTIVEKRLHSQYLDVIREALARRNKSDS